MSNLFAGFKGELAILWYNCKNRLVRKNIESRKDTESELKGLLLLHRLDSIQGTNYISTQI